MSRFIGWLFIILIRMYKGMISPFLPARCRYTPSCSEYGLQAIQKYGPLKGSWLTLKELDRVIHGEAMGTTPYLKY